MCVHYGGVIAHASEDRRPGGKVRGRACAAVPCILPQPANPAHRLRTAGLLPRSGMLRSTAPLMTPTVFMLLALPAPVRYAAVADGAGQQPVPPRTAGPYWGCEARWKPLKILLRSSSMSP